MSFVLRRLFLSAAPRGASSRIILASRSFVVTPSAALTMRATPAVSAKDGNWYQEFDPQAYEERRETFDQQNNSGGDSDGGSTGNNDDDVLSLPKRRDGSVNGIS